MATVNAKSYHEMGKKVGVLAETSESLIKISLTKNASSITLWNEEVFSIRGKDIGGHFGQRRINIIHLTDDLGHTRQLQSILLNSQRGEFNLIRRQFRIITEIRASTRGCYDENEFNLRMNQLNPRDVHSKEQFAQELSEGNNKDILSKEGATKTSIKLLSSPNIVASIR